MSKPTPGPWRVDPEHWGDVVNLQGVQIVVVEDANDASDWPFGTLLPPVCEAKANARLISAAPCLLAALKSLHDRLIECSADPISAAEAYDSFYQEMVVAAIAKAKGEAP